MAMSEIDLSSMEKPEPWNFMARQSRVIRRAITLTWLQLARTALSGVIL